MFKVFKILGLLLKILKIKRVLLKYFKVKMIFFIILYKGVRDNFINLT